MPDLFQDVIDFHKKFGLEYTGKPRKLEEELSSFRQRFLEEELDEYQNAVANMDILVDECTEDGWTDADRQQFQKSMENALDALIDLVYVALGTAQMHGFNFNEGWRRVHGANMVKVRAEKAEDSKRGTTFDVVKPEGWTPPSHADLVKDHAHLAEVA